MGVGLSRPTAYAAGYSLPPAPRAEFFNELLTQDTNGASPQSDDTCLFVLLQCKNLTHLHQIFDFKISRFRSSNFDYRVSVTSRARA